MQFIEIEAARMEIKGKLKLSSGLKLLPELVMIVDAKTMIVKLPLNACVLINPMAIRKLRRQTLFLTET